MRQAIQALLAVYCVVCMNADLSAQENWRTYCNARFGQCADIPSNFRSDPPPVNGDGLVFRDQKGMTITVSARYNIFDSTIASEQNDLQQTWKNPTYRAKGSNWFVSSGVEDSKIYYIREIVTPELIATLMIEYPKEKKDMYDDVVARVARSFEITRPGSSK